MWVLIQLLRLVLTSGFVYTFVVLYPQTDNLPLLIFLGVFVVLPVVLAIGELRHGRKGFQRLINSIFYALLRVFIATLAQSVGLDLIVAAIIGVVLSYVVQVIRDWQNIQAKAALSQARQALKNQKARDAVKLAERAHNYSLSHSDHTLRADTEVVLGMALSGSQQTRARQYLRNAQALYIALGQETKAAEVADLLTKMSGFGRRGRRAPVTDEALPVVTLDDKSGGISWDFIINGELSIAMSVFLLQYYPDHLLQAGLLVHITAGVTLFCLVYGLYAFAVSSRGWLLRLGLAVVYTLALAGAAVSALAYAYLTGWLATADFPTWAQIPAARLLDQIVALNPLPQAEFFAGMAGAALLVMLIALILSRGTGARSRREARDQSVGQALELASQGSWAAASETLNQIDMLKVRDAGERERLLFYKAFTEFQAGKLEIARQHLDELLETHPNNPYALYLLGYAALKQGELEAAQRHLGQLFQKQPDFVPSSGSNQQSVRYLYSLALYRLAMKLMSQQVDAGAELLAEVGRVGGLNKELADGLMRVHLHRITQHLRQRDLQAAQQELKLAAQQLEHLETLIKDPLEVKKLRGLYQAAKGLLALQAERYEDAAANLDEAATETREIRQDKPVFERGGGSFFEQLLAAARQSREGSADKLPAAFYADLHLLRAVAALHRMRLLSGSKRRLDARTHLKDIEGRLEQSLSVREDFLEARALLGLLYFYNNQSAEEREKGYDMLLTVKGRVKSRLLSHTVEKWEQEVQRQHDARRAYFDVLQQFMRSGDVPLEERVALRDAVLKDMEANGQYEEFVGYGNLEVDSARDTALTVEEYRLRAQLLQEKIAQLKQAARDGRVDPAVDDLVSQLATHNQALEALIATIASTEKDLLMQARHIL